MDTKDSSARAGESRIWTPASGTAPIGYHLIARLADDRVIAPTASDRRLLARVVYEQGEDRGLVAFRGADTHLHILTIAGRATAGELARYTLMSLRWRLRLPVPFEPCRIRPITDQRHLDNGARYVFRQEAHHDIGCDPFHDASSLVDLLGLRRLGTATTARFRRMLPRISRDSLRSLAGWATKDDAPIDPSVLADATLSAAGLPAFAHDESSRIARCAACHALNLPARQVAELLGISAAAVRKLRQTAPDAELLQSVRAQLALRSGAIVGASSRPESG